MKSAKKKLMKGEMPPVVFREWLLWSGFAPWYKENYAKEMGFTEFLKLRVAEWERAVKKGGSSKWHKQMN